MRKYAICDIELLDEVDSEGELVFDFGQVLESGRATIRTSNDGLLFIAKWECDRDWETYCVFSHNFNF